MFIIENNRKLFRCVQYFIIVALCLQFGVSSGLTQPTVSHTTNETTTATTSRTKSFREKMEEAKLPHIIMTVGAIGVVCNTLLILAIVIDPLKILHRGAWITIVNLSVADLLACGSSFLTWFVFQKQDREIKKAVEKPTRFFWLFGVSASFMLLTLLTIQIYMIIKYPMKSRLLLTKKKILLSCMIIWVIAIPFGLLDVDVWFEEEDINALYYHIGYIAVFELVVLFQIVLKILIIVEILSSRDGHLLNSESQSNQKQREVAKTVLMLNVILFVTAFPWFVFKQIELVSRLENPGNDPLPEMLYYYYEPIALLNFIANPLLYSLRLPDYRRSLLALLKCECKMLSRSKRSSSSSQSMTRNKTLLMGNSETTRLETTKL